MSFTVYHVRPLCTGCRSCYDIDPTLWRMETDGLSHLIGSVTTDDGNEILVTTGKKLELCLEVAQSCPVNVIHIIKDDVELV